MRSSWKKKEGPDDLRSGCHKFRLSSRPSGGGHVDSLKKEQKKDHIDFKVRGEVVLANARVTAKEMGHKAERKPKKEKRD